MARRIDVYDYPTAPPANGLVASVKVAVTNAVGDVLLIRRSDNQNWALPGGAARRPGLACLGSRFPTLRGRRPDE